MPEEAREEKSPDSGVPVRFFFFLLFFRLSLCPAEESLSLSLPLCVCECMQQWVTEWRDQTAKEDRVDEASNNRKLPQALIHGQPQQNYTLTHIYPHFYTNTWSFSSANDVLHSLTHTHKCTHRFLTKLHKCYLLSVISISKTPFLRLYIFPSLCSHLFASAVCFIIVDPTLHLFYDWNTNS